jgi:hypothetical protein
MRLVRLLSQLLPLKVGGVKPEFSELGWQKFIYPLLDTNITEVMNRVIEAIMLP